MDRRLFLTGLLGAAGTVALAAALPREAQALAIGPAADVTPQTGGILPELKAASEETVDEGVEVAWHNGRPHPRRRVRRRQWRRTCRRYRNEWGHWVSRCRRVPFWGFIWL